MKNDLKDVAVGDLVFTAEWGTPHSKIRNVFIYAYKATKLTDCGFHAEHFATLDGFSKYWQPATNLMLRSISNPRERWIGHNSRQFFSDQQSSIDRLIMRRRRYVSILEYKLSQARYDIKNLKEGRLQSGSFTINIFFKFPKVYPTGLDSGIEKIVYRLIDAGFNTTDSGDGSKYPDMECALPFPHVFATTSPETMISESHRMLEYLPNGWLVEASYSTEDNTCILFAREKCNEENSEK